MNRVSMCMLCIAKISVVCFQRADTKIRFLNEPNHITSLMQNHSPGKQSVLKL